MSEPITVLPAPYDFCEGCATNADNGALQLLRCSTCKNRFYCSSACQKQDWKSHKMNCSPLPVPLITAIPESSAEMTAEVRRSVALLKRVADAWKRIDEGEASKELPKEQRLALKSQEPSYAALCYYVLPPAYAWKTNLFDKKHPAEHVINSLRRLYWIDTVANIKTEQDRADLKAALTSMVHTPSYIARLVPEKVLARPASLSPGEYRVVEMAVIMSSKSCGCGIHGAGHTTDAVDEAYEKRWLYLATLDNQGRGENSDQPLYYCNLSGVACV